MSAAAPSLDVRESLRPPKPHVLHSNQVQFYTLSAVLMFAPLAFGAVEPWAIFLLEFSAAALLCAWTAREIRGGRMTVRWSPAFLPMAAFAVLAIIQMLPGISAYRHATSSSLLLVIAYGVICFLFDQTFERTTQLRRLAVMLTAYGVGMATFAVLQSLSSAGKLYWVRTPRFGGWIYGPYVNHNHYAGLMEMLAPVPLIYAFSRYAYGRKKWIAASAAAFMGASIFLSGSRGGMTAFTIELAVFLYFLFRERSHSRAGLLMGAFIVIAVSCIAWIGGREVTSRISTFGNYKRPDLTADIRFKIDRDALHMIARRPLLGWGLGTFADVYPQFRSFYTDSTVNEAHNDYLQLWIETGLCGFAIGIWFLAVVLRRSLPKTRDWPSDVNGMAALAALLGITGILVHSFVDFNLEIPANALWFFVLCTIAAMDARFRNLRRTSKRPDDAVAEFSPAQAQSLAQ